MPLLHLKSRQAGAQSVIFDGQGHAKHRDNRIADVFIQGSSLRLKNFGHRSKVLVHQRDELVGAELFGKSGKTFDIREERSDLGLGAPQLWVLIRLHYFIDQFW